jgi:hypothetical protein
MYAGCLKKEGNATLACHCALINGCWSIKVIKTYHKELNYMFLDHFEYTTEQIRERLTY